MRSLRGWTFLVVLVGAGVVLWGSPSDEATTSDASPPADTVRAERSAMPCRASLTWRVGEVDPRGRIERRDVEAAARRAARLWEEVAGRPLFRHAPAGGVPIHVRYDPRVADLNRRLHAMDSAQAALADSARSLRTDAVRLARQERELDRRVRRHNERVRSIEEAGGGSDAEQREVQRVGRALESDRNRLERLRASLDRRSRRLERAREDLREAIEAYNRSPGIRLPIHVGDYSESVKTRGDRVLAVDDRSITVSSLADPTSLALVIAHEMGHALGLGHVPDSVAVMAEVRETGAGGRELTTRLADRRELRRTCPDLIEAP